jgi:phosphatidylserine/phosphatidylglycerophosphate/cardiolipin synthase-like enzyme
MKGNKIIVVFAILILIQPFCIADTFSPDASFDICFTPGENCQKKIIRAIKGARKEVLVQAYNFSDMSIAHALVLAKTRGIEVKILLDKSQLNSKHGLIPYFVNNRIYLKIDDKPAIAHNKVIIIDRAIVLFGSYNFTYAAKNKNAENIVLIKDPRFAEKFVKYWHTRDFKSRKCGCKS